ncbi:MAG: BT_3928 family protein [Chitinophagales bacterium]
MKILVTIARILVGILFIFSGLIKANDPLGLSYKMQEFFEIWGMTGYNSWTLASSVLMNAFEIIAGFALLIGWRIKLFSWLLLLLILFFTFLTGYTFVTGKPTNCGCFGDCLPISSKTSFLKDVALTILIGFIFWQHKNIRPIFSNKISAFSMLGITLLSFGIQWYTLTYLPIIDCLPFKKNNNIPEQMKVPANAVYPVFAITFVYEKNGERKEYTADKLPADLDSTYKLIKRYDKTVIEGKNYMAPIHGFALTGVTDEDSTEIVLSQPYAVLLFCLDFSSPVSKWKDDFEKLYAEAKEKNIPVYAITTQLTEAQQNFAATSFKDIPIFKCDPIAIRTAARSNPCIFLIKQGTVVDKRSNKTMDKITSQIKSLPPQKPVEMKIDSPVQDTSNN